MADSDCVVVMGSNMAENHPVAFRWPMQAKVEHGAVLIHVDPRFTRTSAVADIYAPIRAGSDVAFLGGLVNHVLGSERWNTDPFFRTFALAYTNAATIVNAEFEDAEDNGGVFSGLTDYHGGVPEWPYNGFEKQTRTAPGSTPTRSVTRGAWRPPPSRASRTAPRAARRRRRPAPGRGTALGAARAVAAQPAPIRDEPCRTHAASCRSSSAISGATPPRWSSR